VNIYYNCTDLNSTTYNLYFAPVSFSSYIYKVCSLRFLFSLHSINMHISIYY